MTLYPVIMAGGSGTRFWPLSRKTRPKQFLPLTSARPLIAETAARLSGLATLKNTFVVCGKQHEKLVKKALTKLDKKNVLVEPMARNTAPAIALAALHVFARQPDGILVVLPSDHHIADVPGFQRELSEAARVAEQGFLVTLGIRPNRPETGYGYIRRGEKHLGASHRVQAFVEKPNVQTAEGYVASGEYFWNGGIFVFRADVILKAFAEHMPELYGPLEQLQKTLGKKTYPKALSRLFAKMPATSIDYGVMEKAQNIAVVPSDFGWSDVGSFSALPEVRQADERGNVVTGKRAVVVDCDNCVVLADSRPLAVVGLKDAVVVDSGDAVLVVPKDKSQDVRKVVEALKARKMEQYL